MKRIAAVEATAAKGKKPEDRQRAEDEAKALAADLANFEEKHPFRLLVDDVTPEKLVDIMDAQSGRIALVSSEGGIFDAMSGRYEKTLNLDIYLKGHSGDPMSVDRIGRRTNYLPNPRLTMILTIQPSVLGDLMGNATMKGRGLCARFLYAVCKSKVGRRRVDPEPIPAQVKEEYHAFIRRILSSADSGTITLSQEADRIRLEYAASIEKRLGNEWEHMREWGGKLVGAMLRIAALIHAAEVKGDASQTPISEDTVAAAIKISECLGIHALAAHQAMGADETQTDAKYLWRRIESADQDEISKRDLYHLCKGKFHTVEDMEPALQALADMGYIRKVEQKTGGRPSIKIAVNPLTRVSKYPAAS